jgi:hypothetical protein
VAYLMNIDIDSSSDDSDFVNPPLKRNRGPRQEVHNIPRQPPRQEATHADGEAATSKMQKVLLVLSTLDDTKGYLCTILKLLDTQSHNYIMYMLHQLQRSTFKQTTIWRSMKFGNYTIMLM